MHRIRLLLAFSLLISCTGDKDVSEYGTLFEKVMLSTEGQIRGSSIGDSMESVRLRETLPLTDESDHYLYYSATLNENSDFLVSYYFDDEILFEVNLNIFTSSVELAQELTTNLRSYLSEKYGEPITDNGAPTWEITEQNETVEISLSTDSEENDMTILTLSMLRISE